MDDVTKSFNWYLTFWPSHTGRPARSLMLQDGKVPAELEIQQKIKNGLKQCK